MKRGIAQGEEIAVTNGPENKEFYGWTPDGREIVFARQNKDTGWDLYAATVDGNHTVRPLIVGPFDQHFARVSPDGKWLAYVSDESGQSEVFVQAMSDPNSRAQIPSEGGVEPRWARSGGELFFRAKDKLMSVEFSPGMNSVLASRSCCSRIRRPGSDTIRRRMDAWWLRAMPTTRLPPLRSMSCSTGSRNSSKNNRSECWRAVVFPHFLPRPP